MTRRAGAYLAAVARQDKMAAAAVVVAWNREKTGLALPIMAVAVVVAAAALAGESVAF